MKKRILIFHDKESLKPIGGPCGYLNSLNEGLNQIKQDEIVVDFLPYVNNHHFRNNRKRAINNIFFNCLKPIYRALKHYKFIWNILNTQSSISIDLCQYDLIHFHSTLDLYKTRSQLKKYSGQVILTSHSPEPLSMEIIENGYKFEKSIFYFTYKKLIEMDRFAFNRADYIIFPCSTADEPYLNKWSEYKDIKCKKINGFRYLLTGTISAKVISKRNTIRNKYSIPLNAFVICYVGRHNKIKGFERLKEIGKIILDKYPNVYFLIGGTEFPYKGLKHDRWIEVGWTNEPHSLTNASDIFLLPNLETYFDLILLEVLSIGTPIIASNTGGNKYFKNENGIRLFESIEDCLYILDEIINFSNAQREEMRVSNIHLYQSNFIPEIFAKNYINLIKTLI